MTIPRRLLVDRDSSGFYHCINRCVRRAFLCGNRHAHRKRWIHERLRFLSGVFAIDVCGYAIMSNHVHVIVHTDPKQAAEWSPKEVVGKWLRLFCPRAIRESEELLQEVIRAITADAERVAVLRDRLSDLSWFMRCLSETIARRANREDECTGRFWEGRFRSHRLLDEAAVIACLAYVDLNPVRAGQARSLKECEYTSLHERTAISSARNKRRGERRPSRSRYESNGLAPLSSGESDPGFIGLSLEDYTRLVDASVQAIRRRQAAALPEMAAQTLCRLPLDSEACCRAIRKKGRMIGTAIGLAAQLAREADRRGTSRVVSALALRPARN